MIALTWVSLLITAQGSSPKWENLESTVIYEVNLRAHAPHANFNGVRSRLAEIKKLGVNVLWLMPIFPVGKLRTVGQLGSPYAVQDYSTVNPEFGSMADFDALVASAHRLGIRVILDWVANHTAWDHPWIKNEGWHAVDSNGNIVIPPGTNWNDVAELNFNNADMRRAMIAAMSGWVVDHKVDGFRCDFADGVPSAFWKSAISSIRQSTSRPLLFLAEGSRLDLISSGFDLTYGWPAYGAIKEVFAGKREVKDFWPVTKPVRQLRFITNHDECAWDDSPVAIFGSAQAAFGAFATLAFTGGTPLIYTGQEVGWAPKIPFFDRSTIDWKSGASIRKQYESLMKFRERFLASKPGLAIQIDSPNIVAFTRSSKKQQILFVLNPSSKGAEFPVPPSWRSTSQDALTNNRVTLGEKLALEPAQLRIFVR